MSWPFFLENNQMDKLKHFNGQIPYKLKPAESFEIELTSEESDANEHILATLKTEANYLPIKGKNYEEAPKPATNDEMINHLSKRIDIQENDVPLLKRVIRENMYHRVAYFAKLLFNKKRSKPTVADLIELFSFDAYLRTSISRLIPPIEQYAKATLSELLIEKSRNSEAYLLEEFYKIGSDRDKLRFRQALAKCSNDVIYSKKKDSSVKHNIEEHGGHVPIWTFYDVLTFGEFNMLATCLEKRVLSDWLDSILEDGKKYDSIIGMRPKSLPSLLQTVQLLRNAAVHNSRIYGQKFVYNPPFNKKDNEYWKKYERKDFEINKETVGVQIHSLFSGLIVIRFFYTCMNNKKIEQWESFRDKLKDHCDSNNFLNLSGYLGFPDNWYELLKIKC